jgi:periplasmic divalent cation tolerance protein
MDIRVVYITVGNLEEAKNIGRTLVSERLAACANIIDNITSFYWWEGKLQEDREVVLIAKTTQPLVQQVMERVKTLHSYTCPCIVTLPVEAGNTAFLEWVEKETSSGLP